MPYSCSLGDVDYPVLIPGFTPEQANVATDDGNGGIDWTQVITTGEQVIGTVINHGTPLPTRYPVYTATSTALASAMPLLLIGGAVLLLMRRR